MGLRSTGKMVQIKPKPRTVVAQRGCGFGGGGGDGAQYPSGCSTVGSLNTSAGGVYPNSVSVSGPPAVAAVAACQPWSAGGSVELLQFPTYLRVGGNGRKRAAKSKIST